MSLFFSFYPFRHYYDAKTSGCVSSHLNNQQKLKHERHNMTSITHNTDKHKDYYFRSLTRITNRRQKDNTLSYGNGALHFPRDEEKQTHALMKE